MPTSTELAYSAFRAEIEPQIRAHRASWSGSTVSKVSQQFQKKKYGKSIGKHPPRRKRL